jgi:zinc/manganese transport system substrate-binding protein
MKRRTLLVAPPALIVAGLTPGRAAQPGGLKVVASFSILADMTRQVGGDAVSVTTLVGPDADVHRFRPRPGDIAAVKSADLVVENGLGLEPWLTRLERSMGFAGRRVVATARVKPRMVTENGRHIPDPHAWQDPRNGVFYVQAIADGLAATLPAQASTIRARADAYAGRIAALDGALASMFAEIPDRRRRMVTSHDAFGYFGARYGIGVNGIEAADNDADLSQHHLAELTHIMKATGVRAVFPENIADPRIAERLARESGARLGPVLYSDALSPPDGPAPTYLDLLQTNAQRIAGALARE